MTESTGPWGAALDLMQEWDPQWAAACLKMSMNPWRSGVLSRPFVELVSAAVSASCTNLDAEASRRHIRAALDAGATREQIVFVLKCATVVSLHSCSLSAPILIDEARKAGLDPAAPERPATPAVDGMRAAGQWNSAWDPFLELDPVWTEEMMTVGVGIYSHAPLSPKEIELLSIALDASVSHMYEPGVRRHIRGALTAGATPQEIMEVLKICVALGVSACNLGLSILRAELT